MIRYHKAGGYGSGRGTVRGETVPLFATTEGSRVCRKSGCCPSPCMIMNKVSSVADRPAGGPSISDTSLLDFIHLTPWSRRRTRASEISRIAHREFRNNSNGMSRVSIRSIDIRKYQCTIRESESESDSDAADRTSRSLISLSNLGLRVDDRPRRDLVAEILLR